MPYQNLQDQVRQYDKRMGWRDPSDHIVLHMAEELGEIARNTLREKRYKKEKFISDELGQEICDLLYLTLKLANNQDIDLNRQWDMMFSRYESKKSRS
ncbi:MAG: hypothetical protein GF334_12195 [Candidatus Altiarchaeales archaeon]|nr:hypothetical protein [Candidatus Altiarchaeales archaeon]